MYSLFTSYLKENTQ